MNTIPLKDLRKNVKATVARVRGCGEYGRRIRSMGIYPGATVEILERPLFSESLIIRVDGCSLALNLDYLDCVTVAVED